MSTDLSDRSGETTHLTERTPQGAELAARFWQRLRVIATRRTGDASAANDVARETLRRVTEAMRPGQPERPAALPGLVFQIARPVCTDRHGPAARGTLTAPSGVKGHDRGDRPAPPIETLTHLIPEERRLEVRQAFRALRDGDQKVLRLAYLELLNVDQIATRLGSAAGAVRVRKHRALRRLAENLAIRLRDHAAAAAGR